MRNSLIAASLVVGLAAFLGMVIGGLVGVIYRRKLAVLLRDRHPSIMAAAQASPDVYPLGVPMASSSRLLRVIRDSQLSDTDVLRLARTLRLWTRITLTSAFVVIAFMLVRKLKLW